MVEVLNVFGMYAANNNRAGFWIIRDSWRNVVARVVSIADVEAGPLAGRFGKPPYFDKAKQSVYAETYDVIKDEHGWLFKQTVPRFDVCPTDPKLSIISCPGTYGYTLLDLAGKQVRVHRLGDDAAVALEVPPRPEPLPLPAAPVLSTEQLEEVSTLVGQYGALRIEFDPSKPAYLVQFSYAPALVECVKSAPAKHRSWSAATRTWSVDITCGQVIRELIALSESEKAKPEPSR